MLWMPSEERTSEDALLREMQVRYGHTPSPGRMSGSVRRRLMRVENYFFAVALRKGLFRRVRFLSGPSPGWRVSPCEGFVSSFATRRGATGRFAERWFR